MVAKARAQNGVSQLVTKFATKALSHLAPQKDIDQVRQLPGSDFPLTTFLVFAFSSFFIIIVIIYIIYNYNYNYISLYSFTWHIIFTWHIVVYIFYLAYIFIYVIYFLPGIYLVPSSSAVAALVYILWCLVRLQHFTWPPLQCITQHGSLEKKLYFVFRTRVNLCFLDLLIWAI